MSSLESSDDEGYLAQLLGDMSLPDDPEVVVGMDSWTPVTDFPTIISIDDVDEYLLQNTRQELEIVKNRLIRRMFGNRNCQLKNVKAMDLVKQFLDPILLGLISLQINQHIVGDALSHDEVLSFLRVQLYLSIY